MTIWRDWTGTNSVTGKPRPGATPPSDTPLREALNRTSQWAIPHALEGACLFRRHRLIRSEQELFVPRPGAAPDLWETFWAPREASEPSRALEHALGAQALALTLPAPSPLPASRVRL